jgi:copper chaperone NosL
MSNTLLSTHTVSLRDDVHGASSEIGKGQLAAGVSPPAAHRKRWAPLWLSVVAAACLLASLKLPLWHLRMEAPQYRDQEALRVRVFPGVMTGDLREITVLNQYIGVHIPSMLPQSRWLPQALFAAGVVGILASLLPRTFRRVASAFVPIAFAAVVALAVFQAKRQMYDIGHKRDAHTKLARVQDFTPPFLGTAKIAQFTVTSSLGAGAYLIGAAILLQTGAAFVSNKRSGSSQ